MVCILAHQHVCDGAFRRQAASDQPRGRRCLDDAIGAGAAGVFGADRHDHPALRRNDVEPLAAVLADPVHLAAAAWAHQAVGLDHTLDARQPFRHVAAIAPGDPFALGRVIPRRLHLLLFAGLGDGNLKVLEGQLAIIFTELLGLLAVDHVVQLGHQMLKAFDDVFQLRGPRSSYLQGLEGRAVIRRQNGQVEVFGSGAHGQVYNPGSSR